MKRFPALDCRFSDIELLYAALDDLSPTAIEEHHDSLRVFFSTAEHRDTAQRALAAHFPASPVDVPDEDWARRSQQGLPPITVGQIAIVSTNPQSPIPNHRSIVIAPSMGFGTGHHATTRLCLAALQDIDVIGKNVLDVGTGSGVLAIAARALGAARCFGIDFDPDAVQSARENLELNPWVSDVTFAVADVTQSPAPNPQFPLPSPEPPAPSSEPPRWHIVTANLTGALLTRKADTLLDLADAGGHLILSGLMTSERDEVVTAFRRGTVVWERSEDEWIGLAVKKS